MSWTLRSFRSTGAVLPAETSTDAGPPSSYPLARMRSEWRPGSSFACGKLKRPWASLTTLIVTVEPAFFALMTTPSMMPSSTEVTRPVNATAGWARARLAVTTSKKRFVGMGISLAASGRGRLGTLESRPIAYVRDRARDLEVPEDLLVPELRD